MDEAKKTGLPLQAMVRDRIEHMILSGELKAGEHLNENALAAELNVSRGPIREATRSLADAGLLTIMRNRGAFVREISLEDVLHVYDVRAGLASVAGRLAALRTLALMDWPWKALSAAAIVPWPLRDFVYKLVAASRYTVFGKSDECRAPSGDFAARFIDFVEKPDADPIAGGGSAL